MYEVSGNLFFDQYFVDDHIEHLGHGKVHPRDTDVGDVGKIGA